MFRSRHWIAVVAAGAALVVCTPNIAGAMARVPITGSIVSTGGTPVATPGPGTAVTPIGPGNVVSTGGTPAATTGPAYTGPTPGLAAVANNLSFKAKSVTTLITVPAGLPVHKTVNISVGYGNGYRITQDYVPSTGNHFLYNFPEGDQQPHLQDIWVTLTQKKADGSYLTLPVEWQPEITPLYDVSISPLTFTLTNGCETIGDSNIQLEWLSSDGSHATIDFSTDTGEHKTFPEFASTFHEVSASSNLRQPSLRFFDTHPLPNWWELTGHFAPSLPLEASSTRLVPGASASYGGNPTPSYRHFEDGCSAWMEYHETYTLDWYPYL